MASRAGRVAAIVIIDDVLATGGTPGRHGEAACCTPGAERHRRPAVLLEKFCCSGRAGRRATPKKPFTSQAACTPSERYPRKFLAGADQGDEAPRAKSRAGR